MTIAVFNTSAGIIRMKLFPERAPLTVENFVALANGTKEWTDPSGETTSRPLYSGTVFHRIIPDFMIQGGDPRGNGTGGPGYRFKDETSPADKFDKPGILAMANSGPNTNGSQFFITVIPTPWLNGRHTIFGECADEESLALVLKMSKVKTGNQDRPLEEIKVNSVAIEE